MARLVTNGVYRHFKGNYYLVVGVARHSEDGEDYVVYRPLYGDTSQLWIRPRAMFLEAHDGVEPRFTYLPDGLPEDLCS